MVKRDWLPPLVFGAFAAALLLSAGLAHGHHGASFTEEWIAEQEDLRLEPYLDVAGVLTVCVGHTEGVEERAYTRDECLDLLSADLEWVTAVVLHALHDVYLPLPQETALVSLAFNVGPVAVSQSRLVQLINEGAPQWQIVLEWLSWDHAHVRGRKQVVEGLLDRRRAEVTLYYGGGE